MVFISTSTFLYQPTQSLAAQVNTDIDNKNPMGIVIEESNETKENLKITSSPDLGDDQAFPFIPGFGKNSGKD